MAKSVGINGDLILKFTVLELNKILCAGTPSLTTEARSKRQACKRTLLHGQLINNRNSRTSLPDDDRIIRGKYHFQGARNARDEHQRRCHCLGSFCPATHSSSNFPRVKSRFHVAEPRMRVRCTFDASCLYENHFFLSSTFHVHTLLGQRLVSIPRCELRGRKLEVQPLISHLRDVKAREIA